MRDEDLARRNGQKSPDFAIHPRLGARTARVPKPMASELLLSMELPAQASSIAEARRAVDRIAAE